MRTSLIEKTLTCFTEGVEFFPPEELRPAVFLLASAVVATMALWRLAKRETPSPPVRGKGADLLKGSILGRIVNAQRFPFFLRLLPAAVFTGIIAAGLFGSVRSNIAAPFVWLFWWTALIFFVAFGGKIFCSVCPWDFFANLFQFGSKASKGAMKNNSLNKKLPKALANIYPACALFVLITWLELGFDITRNSFWTAVMGTAALLAATLSALIFEKRSFCRYLCPVGRVSGIYSLISPLELRPRSLDVCKSCVTKECVKGGKNSTPCPTGLVPFKLKQNTYCTLCTECVRSCEKNNMTIRLRPFGKDLLEGVKIKKDEETLIFFIISLTFFHGITMNEVWPETVSYLKDNVAALNYLGWFTLLMTFYLVFALGMWSFSKKYVNLIGGSRAVFSFLVPAAIPLVLGFHLAHNSAHFFNETTYLIPLLNDPVGRGWNLIGLKNFRPFPLIDAPYVFLAEQAALWTGAYYAFKILAKRLQRLKESGLILESRVKRVYLAKAFIFFCLALVSLFLTIRPMALKGA